MLDLLVELCKKDLKRIRKRESKLNDANISKLDHFKKTANHRQELVTELKKLAASNKEHLGKCDDVDAKLKVTEAKIDETVED